MGENTQIKEQMIKEMWPNLLFSGWKGLKSDEIDQVNLTMAQCGVVLILGDSVRKS